jgi:hypothetical protein
MYSSLRVSDIDPNIINNFVRQQNQLMFLIKQTAELDLRRTKIWKEEIPMRKSTTLDYINFFAALRV